MTMLTMSTRVAINRQEPDELVCRRSTARIWMRHNGKEILSETNQFMARPKVPARRARPVARGTARPLGN
jgi:hypothetical protein